MKKYNFNPFIASGSKNQLESEIEHFKDAYDRCDIHIQEMRFGDEQKKTYNSPMEIHLYVQLRKAISDLITALDDIETCRRHLYGEN